MRDEGFCCNSWSYPCRPPSTEAQWQPIETAPPELFRSFPPPNRVIVREDVKYLMLWDWYKEKFIGWMPLPEPPQ